MAKRAPSTITAAHLSRVLEELAPLAYAEPWDNVGLLVGERDQEVARVLLTIDLTRAVLDEAMAGGFDAVVSYHPPIFEGLKRLSSRAPAVAAAKAGLVVYSPHTALDAAPGGTNDVLAALIGVTDARPLAPLGPSEGALKLVTFVPESAVEQVSRALFEAGAGRIGDYTSCSFRSPGTGTFFGEEGTSPAVGEAGRLERQPELRLETVLPLDAVDAAVAALRRAHPYEEPAFDLVRLAAPPTGVGQGRVGAIEATSRAALLAIIKERLDLTHLLVAGPLEAKARRVALCAGAGGALVERVVKSGADVFVTGELKHHHALRLAAAGVTAVCTGHSRCERPALAAVARHLEARLAGVTTQVADADVDPFVVR